MFEAKAKVVRGKSQGQSSSRPKPNTRMFKGQGQGSSGPRPEIFVLGVSTRSRTIFENRSLGLGSSRGGRCAWCFPKGLESGGSK